LPAKSPVPWLAGRGSFASLPDVRTWHNRNTKIVNSLLLRLATGHGKGEPGRASDREPNRVSPFVGVTAKSVHILPLLTVKFQLTTAP
jgi:hypothetical protein